MFSTRTKLRKDNNMWKKQLPNGGQLITNNDENREKLARDMVDAWDDKDLYEFAVDKVEEGLAHYDDEVFNGEWKQFHGED